MMVNRRFSRVERIRPFRVAHGRLPLYQLVLLTLFAISLSACATLQIQKAPNLGAIYNRPAQQRYPDRNPIIVIPGFQGSRLVEQGTGRHVWGAFGGKSANPKDPADARLISLPLGDPEGWPEVVADGVLDRIRFKLLGLPIQLQAYVEILSTLGAAGYRDEDLGKNHEVDYGDDHYTCFQFPYDWRRDNAENAALLHQFILQKKSYVQEEVQKRFGIEDYEVRFDILAHSMGGLLTRYYLRYGDQPLPEDGSQPVLDWRGAEYVERAILVAVPNAGTVKSILTLVNGVKYPTLPKYEKGLVGSYTSGYQMLPRPRHGAVVDVNDPERPILDFLDVDLWIRLGWGLADPEQDYTLQWLLPEVAEPQERRRIAIESLRQNLRKARQFHEALDRPARPPRGTELFLVAGDAVPTRAVIGVDLESGELNVLERGPGDGSVLRSSALMDERVGGSWQPTLVSPVAWEDALFLRSSHLQMTKDPGFSDNVLYRLLEDPRTHSRWHQ
jgi:hypothetical protein